jgi:hypothetical protein
MVFKVKDTIKEMVAPVIVTGTIIGSSIFNPTYAQNKNSNTKKYSDSVKVKRNNYYKPTREEKLKQIHPTNNRIMPKVDVDSTEHLTEMLTALTNGMLLQPVGTTMNLYYGQDKALDLNNLPNKKPGYILKFKEKSIDDVFKSIYNGIDNYYSHSNDVLNKSQIIKNFKELERLVKKYESKDKDWGLYIKDGNILAYEFKNLDEGFYGVEITAIDVKSGKIAETLEGLIDRGKDYSDKVKIVSKEVPVPYPVKVPVYRDTCITKPYTTKPKEPTIDIGVGGGAICESNNGKIVPQARISLTLHKAVFGADVELGAYGGYRKFKENQENIEFIGPYGLTTIHPTLEKEIYNVGGDVLFGGDNLKIGAGANYYTRTSKLKQTFDEILRDHTGNLVKESYNNPLPDGDKEFVKGLRYGPRIGLRAGDFELIGIADFKKHDKPSWGLNLMYQILRK